MSGRLGVVRAVVVGGAGGGAARGGAPLALRGLRLGPAAARPHLQVSQTVPTRRPERTQ